MQLFVSKTLNEVYSYFHNRYVFLFITLAGEEENLSKAIIIDNSRPLEQAVEFHCTLQIHIHSYSGYWLELQLDHLKMLVSKHNWGGGGGGGGAVAPTCMCTLSHCKL